MAFYDDIASTVVSLLNEFGKPATLIRVTKTGPDYDPQTTETTYTIQLVEDDYSLTNRDTTLVQTGDRVVYISPEGEAPLFGDDVEVDGKRYSIVDLSPVQPGPQAVLYKATLRK